MADEVVGHRAMPAMGWSDERSPNFEQAGFRALFKTP
jgi:hypothetical protein